MLCLPVHKVYTLLPERKVLLAPPNGALATRAHEGGVLKFAWNRDHSDVVQKFKTGPAQKHAVPSELRQLVMPSFRVTNERATSTMRIW